MRRLKYPTAAEAQAAEAAAALVAFAGVGKKKRESRTNVKKFREELRTMLTEDSFGDSKPGHLVALYEWAHEQVYGVAPAELTPAAVWKLATFAASRLVREEFAGDAEACVDFVRWTWKRERARETARRSGKNQSVGRIGWRLQFVTRHLLTDYRIDLARGHRG